MSDVSLSPSHTLAVNGATNVIRQCSGVSDSTYASSCVGKLGTHGVGITYCHCGLNAQSACNGATGLGSSAAQRAFLLVALSIAALLVLTHLSSWASATVSIRGRVGLSQHGRLVLLIDCIEYRLIAYGLYLHPYVWLPVLLWCGRILANHGREYNRAWGTCPPIFDAIKNFFNLDHWSVFTLCPPSLHFLFSQF